MKPEFFLKAARIHDIGKIGTDDHVAGADRSGMIW
jgi:response regulator RpfG family c-di-GMP phosphodiesterase